MAYSVEDIKGSIEKNGFLPVNRFIVSFYPPQVLLGQGDQELLQLRAESIRLPDAAFMVSDTNRYGVGPTQKMPYNAMFTDTSVTFIADKDNKIYDYFYKWMSKIFDFSGAGSTSGNVNVNPSYTTEYKDNYVVRLSVDVYDYQGKVKSTVNMYQAYPISLNAINLDWNTQNTLMRVTVGFTFRDWDLELKK